MKIKKKTFNSIKNRYITDMNYSKEEASEYKKKLETYNPKYGSKDHVLERYVYHNTVAGMCELALNNLERLEGKR